MKCQKAKNKTFVKLSKRKHTKDENPENCQKVQTNSTMPLKSWGQIIFNLKSYTQSDSQVLEELLAMQCFKN